MSSIDTVLAKITNQTSFTAVTVATGDSLTVRSFNPPASAYLDGLTLKGATTPAAQLTSPKLYDAVRGITVRSAQAPTLRTLPRQLAQPLYSQDVLALSAISGAADSTAVALHTYYTDLGASDARLYNWGDVAGLIEAIRPVEVDVTASATIGQWNDTVITTTENLLKANTDHVLLGYTLDVACLVVAIKGQDTGNLRIGAPGTTLGDVSAEFFVQQAQSTGRPYLPVINAANVNNTFVSVADNAASTAVKVQLIFGELSSNLP